MKLFYKLHLITYMSMYLIKTFLVWEFTNPFWWILELPDYSSLTRFIILFYVLLIYFISKGMESRIKDEEIMKHGGVNIIETIKKWKTILTIK